MILYRKAPGLRVRRSAAPAPPFWCPTSIAPYSSRRAEPIAIDYLDLLASVSEKLDVVVCEELAPELERVTARMTDPVLIEASEIAEEVYRRGEQASELCTAAKQSTMLLLSTRGALPRSERPDNMLVIAAWPLELARLEALCAAAAARPSPWGLLVPVIFPVTTELGMIEKLLAIAAADRASFFASVTVEVEASARRNIAQSLALDGDDDTYAMLFHADPDPIHVATERHIAALAFGSGMADFVTPPRWREPSNWNAAVLLMLTAGRMIAMTRDVDLAGLLARSGRLIAGLDKPIARIASAASLGIVDALDDAAAGILTEWLHTGRSSFVERINEEWRLRRDYRA